MKWDKRVFWLTSGSDFCVLTTRLLVTCSCIVVWLTFETNWLYTVTHFHTHFLFLSHKHAVSNSHPPAEESVCTFDRVVLTVYISPEAENHYTYFVSRYTCHAMSSSDPRESKVWVMPPEPTLICMRVGAALWCNCGSGEGQCLCPACAHYQSPDIPTLLRFLYGNLHAFWRWRMTLLIGMCK